MKAFKTKKKQRQEERARVIAHIVKEILEKLRAEEEKGRIVIPLPQRFYCMEHKIYETPQDFNEEMNRRTQASNYRNNVAHEEGKEQAAREILQEVKTKGIIHKWEEYLEIDMDVLKALAKAYGIELEN